MRAYLFGANQEAGEVLDLVLGERIQSVTGALEIVEDFLPSAGRC